MAKNASRLERLSRSGGYVGQSSRASGYLSWREVVPGGAGVVAAAGAVGAGVAVPLSARLHQSSEVRKSPHPKQLLRTAASVFGGP